MRNPFSRPITWLAACMAVSVLACTKTTTFRMAKNIVSSGVYTSQTPDAAGISVKLSLNQNNTYIRKKLLKNCQLIENRGEWKSTQEEIEFHTLETRRRPDCNSEWEVDKTEKTVVRMIRNITTRSFDMLEETEAAAAEWIKFIKP